MVYLAALLIFLVITTLTWFVALTVYQFLFPTTPLLSDPNFIGASVVSIFLVTLLSPVPFPAGYLLSLGIWALAAWGVFGLSWGRGGVLFGTLAVLSFISRLAVLGALSL